MESKQEMALEIFDIIGRSETFNKTLESIQYKLDEWSNQQNATLIAEHKMMKETLENMKDAPLGFNFRLTASGTLKKLGR